ncbi:M23 family metallopeptidase [Desulfolutivibrio sulfoxidireducens]|uniref:M23 family metallopeptidase n=1 Tax=Desulfolutivibrio sulfoxidireducens TaxID=2773299 RepID=UPI00159EB3CD|nr:M23 family metallopeptidase [Desulfolutivibrio sulfoxidireducens]QLA17639.1 peptidoglycan DD-metalloendopeptidase family protein [Desulfolutivibrio sulfoxidireducens]QLA21211.1 peptidoglycan DD-metalloendopeptidase family protein [Desulfolutivibrio sulfoxidireducens]
MLKSGYQIFIFQSGKGVRRLVTVRGWLLALPLCALAALAAVNVTLWKYYAGHEELLRQKEERRGALAEQKSVSLRLKERMERVESEVTRIGSFNKKLGIMVAFNPAKDASPAGVGAPGPDLAASSGLYFSRQGALVRKMNEFIEYLGQEIALQEVLQQRLRNTLREKKLEFEARPSLWPMRGYITSGFGPRRSPFGRRADFHNGVDIKAPHGSPIHAPGAGRVTDVDYQSGYGLRVVIVHDFGISTLYGHLKSAVVTPGQEVRRGQLIAYSGNSGRTTGTHLHYEVQVNGEPVNPLRFMLD